MALSQNVVRIIIPEKSFGHLKDLSQVEEQERLTFTRGQKAAIAAELGELASDESAQYVARSRELEWEKRLLADHQPLEPKDYAVWCKWLDTRFTTASIRKQDVSSKNRRWSNFRRSMPIEIREELAEHMQARKSGHGFDQLEIRAASDQGLGRNTVVFGWIGDQVYMVAEWGPLSTDLDKVKAGVFAVTRVRANDLTMVGWIVGGMLVSIVAIIVAKLFFSHGYWPLGGLVLIADVVAVALLERWKFKKTKRSNDSLRGGAPYAFKVKL